MADAPKKVYYTRQRRHLEEEQAKRVPTHIASTTPTTQLTDVNVDCLVHIFKYLSVAEKLNLADLNKHLKIATNLVFQEQYRKKWVKVDSCKIGFYENDEYEVIGPTTQIPRSFCFKLLRCFGNSITKLNITYPACNYKWYSGWYAHLDRYITEYCAESLLEFTLVDCSARTLANLTKPFPKMEAVSFINCQLGSKLSKLDKWFPMMRRLRFGGANEISNGNAIAVRLPNLQDLYLDLPLGVNLLNTEHFAGLMRQNSQIRTLYINGRIDIKYLQRISVHLQHLERLEINTSRLFVNRGCNTELVLFSNVKKLKFTSTRGGSNALYFLAFDNPEEFIIKSSDGTILLDHELADFISKYTSLTKLTYRCRKEGEEGVLSKISSPELVEVNFGLCTFPIDEVIAFMEKCKALKKFSAQLFLFKQNDFQAVLERFGGNWSRPNDHLHCWQR